MSDSEWLRMHIVAMRADQKSLEKKVDEKFTSLESKVDQLIVKEAKREGKVSGASLVISALVSLVITAIGILTK